MKKVLIAGLILFGIVGVAGCAGEAPAKQEEENRFKPATEAVFGESSAEEEKKETEIYNDEKLTIYFSKVSTRGVELYIQNKTDVQFTIQADSIAINGISQNKLLVSDEIAPQSKGRVFIMCNTSEFDKDVKTVSGALSVIDFENYSNTYKVSFVNVEV